MIKEWFRITDDSKITNLSQSIGRKKMTAVVLLVAAGILAIIWPYGVKPNETASEIPEGGVGRSFGNNSVLMAQEQLALQVQEALRQVEGAGAVEVRVTLQSDGKRSYASNHTEDKRYSDEKDAGGTNRVIQEESKSDTIALSSGGALLIETEAADILGVLVIAEGANDLTVRNNLLQATTALLNVAAHHVEVMPRKGGK